MKVVAILLLLAVAAHARPQKGGDENPKPEDAGARLFMSLVKLCMRLEQEAGSDDKRSWDAVFGLFGNVCEGIKNALGDDVNELVPAERSMGPGSDMGPRPTGDTPSQDGDKRPPPKKGGRKGDQEEGSGPSPTADFPSQDGDRRPPPKKGGRKGDKEGRSGPSPTADFPSQGDDRKPPPMKGGRRGDKDERSMSEPESPEQQLLKLCFALAELGEQMDNGQDKRGEEELVEVLKGMEQVCLAAFVEAHAYADE